MVWTGVRDDATVFTLEKAKDSDVENLIEYLGNENLFPSRRARIVTFVGDVRREWQDRLARSLSPRGFAFDRADPREMAVSRGPASVVWYADSRVRPLAMYWAHRAETVYGTRYVVLGSAADYEALEAQGAIIGSVTDFGGTFPVAAARPGWVVRQPGATPSPGPAAPAGFVDAFPTLDDMRREVVRMFELHRRVVAARGTDDPPSPPGPGSPVDVVFYTGEESVSTPELPLDFYDSSVVMPAYTDMEDCATQSGYCRERVLPVPLDYWENDFFKDDPPDGGNCDKTSPGYEADRQGWPCEYDTVNHTEKNFFDEAVKTRAREILDDLMDAPTNYTIDNVVIVAHWLDIPYRERIFPYRPKYNCEQCYHVESPLDSTPDRVTDADFQLQDSDNDDDVCSGSQNYAARDIAPGICSHNTWGPGLPVGLPDAMDPDVGDDHYEGDAGAFDYYLADFEQRGNDPYEIAHAGFGRLCGRTDTDAQALIGTATEVLRGNASTGNGSVAVMGGPDNWETGGYDDHVAIMECRYGALPGAPIKSPCVHELGGDQNVTCPNESDGTTPANYTPHDLYEMAKTAEIVDVRGHTVNFYFTDNQRVQFVGTGSNPDSEAMSSQSLSAEPTPVGGWSAGVWTFRASDCFEYAWTMNYFPGTRPCENGNPCYNPAYPLCDTTEIQQCLYGYTETSFVEELTKKGVLAMQGGFAGHYPGPDMIVPADNTDGWLRELAAGTPLGKAHKISLNEARALWHETPSRKFEIATKLIGDPLVSLGPPQSTCPNAPVFVVGKGQGQGQPWGTPQVRGFRADGVGLDYVLDYKPFAALPPPVLGNHVATGNLANDIGSTTDEIASTRGPGSGYDTLVKIHRWDGTLLGSFWGFGTSGYGATVAVGKIKDSSGLDDIVVGRGPGSSFGPTFRIWKYAGGWAGEAEYSVAYGCGLGACYYGVNVATGDFDADGLEEIATGKGSPPTNQSGYNSEIRFFDGNGGTPQEITAYRIPDAFPTYSPSLTFGATVGSADLDGLPPARDEILVGKGAGYEYLGFVMDDDVAVWQHDGGAPGSFVHRLTIDNPFGMAPYTAPGIYAGARAAGYAHGPDDPTVDDILIVRGPVTHACTDPYPPVGSPPSFRGSDVKVIDVDPSGWTWTEIMDVIAYHDIEQPGDPSTQGGSVARIQSGPLAAPGGSFAPGRRLRTHGEDTTEAGGPVWPWKSGREIAVELISFVEGMSPDVLARAESREEMTSRLDAIRSDLVAGALGTALARATDLLGVAAAEVANRQTLGDVLELFTFLRMSIEQQLANRPPEIVVEARHVFRAPDGHGRAVLDAARSTDADSTPGTKDNIRAYRWYWPDGTSVLGDGPRRIVELEAGPSGTATFAFTVEVEDAYGAIARATSLVTMEKGR